MACATGRRGFLRAFDIEDIQSKCGERISNVHTVMYGNYGSNLAGTILEVRGLRSGETCSCHQLVI